MTGDGTVSCPSCGQRTAIDRGLCWWCDEPLSHGFAPAEAPPSGHPAGCGCALILLGVVLAGCAVLVNAFSTLGPGWTSKSRTTDDVAGIVVLAVSAGALVLAGLWRLSATIERRPDQATGGLLPCPSCGQRTAPGAECQWCDRPLGGRE